MNREDKYVEDEVEREESGGSKDDCEGRRGNGVKKREEGAIVGEESRRKLEWRMQRLIGKEGKDDESDRRGWEKDLGE